MTDREISEMIARFRTPPGFSWQDLANDIETVLKSRPRPSPGEAANIISRLRENAELVPAEYYSWFNPLLLEAAAEIERLRELNEEQAAWIKSYD